jgi:hypothetical protein
MEYDEWNIPGWKYNGWNTKDVKYRNGNITDGIRRMEYNGLNMTDGM